MGRLSKKCSSANLTGSSGASFDGELVLRGENLLTLLVGTAPWRFGMVWKVCLARRGRSCVDLRVAQLVSRGCGAAGCTWLGRRVDPAGRGIGSARPRMGQLAQQPGAPGGPDTTVALRFLELFLHVSLVRSCAKGQPSRTRQNSTQYSLSTYSVPCAVQSPLGLTEPVLSTTLLLPHFTGEGL